MTAPRTLAVLLALCVLCPFLSAGPVVREPGAIYLEDLLVKPVKVNVPAEGPIYFDIQMQRYLGQLKAGQIVEIQAVSDHAFRVKGLAKQGQVLGWIDPQFLGQMKPDFLANLKKAAKRHEDVAALIARKEVAVNMTKEEVFASLGKAGKTVSRVDASGQHEVWEYIKYDDVPQQTTGYDRFGNLVANTIYVKMPVGKLSVVFENNIVTSLEQSEDNLAKDNQAKILVPPVDLY